MADLCMLMGAAQKAAKDPDAAMASYDKAIQLREALSAANPDDEDMASQLESARKELDKVKSATPAKVAAAPEAEESEAEEPAAEEPAAEEPAAEEPAAEDAPVADPPADDAPEDVNGEQPSDPVAAP